ncbi:RICIN domain-containing protein [Haliscomenobacter sp.]|uniref:RICIN domain-containing protein n=1 Tax=Haliscomenobacter sp. TaxID=2717303 RepID=UPI0035940663
MKTLFVSVFALLLSVATFAQFDGGTYRMKTQFRGENECLEGNKVGGSVRKGNSFMDQCQFVTGQMWKVVDAGNGYYRLQTLFLGKDYSLEGNQAASPDMAGAVFMNKTQNVTGQLWKIEAAGNGYYRLKNQFRGANECLEGNQFNGTVKGGIAFMDKCQNVSGQLWKFVKVDPTQRNTLTAGQTLATGQRLDAPNGSHYLIMQTDGNVVIYTTVGNKPIWATQTQHKSSGGKFTMQADGNLVLYSASNQSLWSSQTHPYFDKKFAAADMKPVKAVLENDGALVLYANNNKKVWSSK